MVVIHGLPMLNDWTFSRVPRSHVRRQQRWRRLRARKEFFKLIEHVFEKIRDPESGAFYYHDRRTGETTWSKPKLLGNRDIAETFYLKEYVAKEEDSIGKVE